jgi:dTDP-4-dehydrorhamnose 3,5-epimerase
MLHGFVVTSEVAQVEYKCTAPYVPHAEFSVAWNDPDIGIPWPIDQPLLSDRDGRAPRLRDVHDRLLDY